MLMCCCSFIVFVVWRCCSLFVVGCRGCNVSTFLLVVVVGCMALFVLRCGLLLFVVVCCLLMLFVCVVRVVCCRWLRLSLL